MQIWPICQDRLAPFHNVFAKWLLIFCRPVAGDLVTTHLSTLTVHPTVNQLTTYVRQYFRNSKTSKTESARSNLPSRASRPPRRLLHTKSTSSPSAAAFLSILSRAVPLSIFLEDHYTPVPTTGSWEYPTSYQTLTPQYLHPGKTSAIAGVLLVKTVDPSWL